MVNMSSVKSSILGFYEFLRLAPLYILFFFVKRKQGLIEELNTWYSVLPISSWRKKKDWKSFAILFLRLKEYRSLVYCRLHWNASKPNVFRWIYPPQPTLYLGDSSRLGGNVVIQHGFSTIINCESIGANCQIWQNVTIGVAKSGGGKPKIGQNVKICANSVVLGPIKIGNNVTIGASSVVIRDIPDGCTVVGNPARIIDKLC